jgi:hypothetical protein
MVAILRITRPIRGRVRGRMPVEDLSPWPGAGAAPTRGRRLLRTVSSGRSPRPDLSRLGVSAQLDRGRKRELCEDVTFQPLLAAFVHTPIAAVLARVQGAMCAMGVRLSPIDGPPGLDGESARYLQAVVSPHEPPQGAITTRNERFVSTAA